MEESIDILIVSYLKGEATNDQQKELLAWLELSEENRFYFRSIKDVYDLGWIESDIRDSQVDRQWHKFLDIIPLCCRFCLRSYLYAFAFLFC